MNMLIASLGAIAIVWLSSLNWRRAVKSVLFIVVFEGVLRKWVLPQASDMIYFLKDLILLGAYMDYFLNSKNYFNFNQGSLKLLIALSFLWATFQVFNPSLSSPIIGIFGLKAYFFYIPLMWVIPNLFKSEEELYIFLQNYLLLLIPVSLLSIAQFFSPPSSPINVYAGGQEATATFQGVGAVRVTGTFPYLAGYTVYLSTCLSFLIPIMTTKQSDKWQWIGFIELFLLVGSSLMTGARGLVLFEIIFLLLYFFMTWMVQPSIASRWLQKMLLPGIIIYGILPRLFGKAATAFSNRAANSDNFLDRIIAAFSAPFEATKHKALDGYGTGATHQAVSTLHKILKLRGGEIPPPSEGETGRIILELGPFGFFFWYALRLSLLLYLGQIFLQLRKPFLRQLALAAFLFQGINITGQLVFNHTFASYYWFVSGFIFLLPQLEKAELAHNLHQNRQIHV